MCVCWEGTWASQVASAKESACNAGDAGSIPGSGRSPRCRNGNPLQYPCLGNSVGRGAWWAAVHGVAKSQTRLNMSMMETMRARTHAHMHTHTRTHTHTHTVCFIPAPSIVLTRSKHSQFFFLISFVKEWTNIFRFSELCQFEIVRS